MNHIATQTATHSAPLTLCLSLVITQCTLRSCLMLLLLWPNCSDLFIVDVNWWWKGLPSAASPEKPGVIVVYCSKVIARQYSYFRHVDFSVTLCCWLFYACPLAVMKYPNSPLPFIRILICTLVMLFQAHAACWCGLTPFCQNSFSPYWLFNDCKNNCIYCIISCVRYKT